MNTDTHAQPDPLKWLIHKRSSFGLGISFPSSIMEASSAFGSPCTVVESIMVMGNIYPCPIKTIFWLTLLDAWTRYGIRNNILSEQDLMFGGVLAFAIVYYRI